MKIMYVIDAGPVNGGAPISTSILANQFAGDDNEVIMVMPKNKDTEILDKRIKRIELARFSDYFPLDVFHPIKALLLAKDLKAVIEKEKPDVIHANMPRGARAIGLLKLLGMISDKIKLVYTDREHISQFSPLVRMLYIFFIARRYDAIICITEKSMEYWRKKARKAKISVVPNTAGKYYETYEPDMHSIVRKKLMIPDKKLTLMFAGRMIEAKNWPLAKEIVSKLSKEDVHIIIAISYFKVINEMMTIMKRQFMEKFKLINENFNLVFRELFDGGRAELILVDKENVLESGIEIEVQPPGKKLQNLMLLSGGERAFTAIALLFCHSKA